MRRHARKLVALAVAGVLAACGGGDQGQPLSLDEFRQQGNAICVAGDAELEQASDELLRDENPGALVRFYTDTAIPVARRKLDRLERLNAPPDIRPQVEELVAKGRAAIGDVEAGLADDPLAYLLGAPDPFEDFDEMAVELGLEQCAGPEEPPPGGGGEEQP